MTVIGCVAYNFFLEIEACQNVHAYINALNVEMTEHWNHGYNILNKIGW